MAQYRFPGPGATERPQLGQADFERSWGGDAVMEVTGLLGRATTAGSGSERTATGERSDPATGAKSGMEAGAGMSAGVSIGVEIAAGVDAATWSNSAGEPPLSLAWLMFAFASVVVESPIGNNAKIGARTLSNVAPNVMQRIESEGPSDLPPETESPSTSGKMLAMRKSRRAASFGNASSDEGNAKGAGVSPVR